MKNLIKYILGLLFGLGVSHLLGLSFLNTIATSVVTSMLFLGFRLEEYHG